jgi:heat induced stress protein YflT
MVNGSAVRGRNGRETIATFGEYQAAQDVVDRLSDAEFPVEHVTIVGSDLHLVENVTGRMTYGRAALRGLLGGLVIGLLFGAFLGLFTETAGSFFGLLIYGVFWGAVAGVFLGLLAYSLQGGTRDFASQSRLVAGQYEVLVDHAHAERARGLVAKFPERSGSPGGDLGA